MNARENITTAMKGGKPERVPNFLEDVNNFYPSLVQNPEALLYGQLFGLLEQGKEPEGEITCTDGFGIQWVLDDNGPFPIPGTTLFNEMEGWRDHFTIPDLDSIDWDKACEEDSQMLDPDKANFMYFYGLFTTLTDAMGFEDALLAIALEPDEVQEFYTALCDFYCGVIERVMQRVRIDIFQICDDVASHDALFISPECYRETLKPLHKRMFDTARKMNPDIVLEQHCCGHCEDIVDDFIENGAMAWEPAEPTNDLLRFKKEGLAIVGGFPTQRITGDIRLTEEDVRQAVRDSIDDYGKDGGFVFFNAIIGSSEMSTQRREWIDDEVHRYGTKVYR